MPEETFTYYPDGSCGRLSILSRAPRQRKIRTDEEYDPEGASRDKKQHNFSNYLVVPKMASGAVSVAITNRWIEPGFHESGRHKHLEAVVYAIEGQGFTDMQGKRIPWEAGDVLYVPPAMWEHQHINENPSSITQIRIGFNIRQWVTSIWPQGFTSTRIYDDEGNPIEAGRIVRKRERSY